MDPSLPNPPNPLRKLVWENIFQFSAALFLIVVLIINWNSAEQNVKIGISLFIIVYLMFRMTFIWQAYRFEKRIEELKKSQTGSENEAMQIYEESLK